MRTSFKRYRRPGAAQRRATLRDGWHPDDRCACLGRSKRPAVVGSSGYWLPGLMCLICARQVAMDA